MGRDLLLILTATIAQRSAIGDSAMWDREARTTRRP